MQDFFGILARFSRRAETGRNETGPGREMGVRAARFGNYLSINCGVINPKWCDLQKGKEMCTIPLEKSVELSNGKEKVKSTPEKLESVVVGAR